MPGDEDVVRTVYLTGQPGSGKTELARQYGEQFKNTTSSNDTSRPLVITVNAKSEESLLKSVNEATRKLQLSQLTNNNLSVLMENLRDYFHGLSGAWVLIIDDMFEKRDFNNFFPRPGAKEWGGGQVLVTTQDNNLVPGCHLFAKKLSLNEGMTKDDALALLKEISDVEVDHFAEEIIEELQYLPLALACCATFVGETRQDRPSTQFGWKEYLDLYRENSGLESRTFSKSNNVYPFSMTTATMMAVKRMTETSDVLRLAFSFLSYCALLPVPLNVLAHHVKENLPVQNVKPSTTEKKKILEIENEISRCTLLVLGQSQNVETVKCHQIIHHAFQSAENTKPVEQRKTEFVKVMKFLNKKLDFMDNTCKEDVLRKVLVRPHLKSFVDYANDMSWNNTAEFVAISKKKDQFLYSTSDMPVEKAVKSLELLRNISSEIDLSDEIRCDILANLGFYYLELERAEDASGVLREAYHMTENKSKEEWLSLRCRISFVLAQTYYSMGNVDHGIEMMKTSIDLARNVHIREEGRVMERFLWLAKFYYSPWKFWKLGAVVKDATDFLRSLPDSESLSRAHCLDYLSRIYEYYDNTESFYKPMMFRNYVKLKEEFINKSLNVYERVLGADVSFCQEYYTLLVESASLKLQANPTEARTQLDKALEYCEQNNDKFNYSVIAARKKHLFDNSSRLSKFCYVIRNLSRGRVLWQEEINMCDDILEDCSSGRIAPSPRMIVPIRRTRTRMVWAGMAYWGYVLFCLFWEKINMLLHSVEF